jgi:hypothetical protein
MNKPNSERPCSVTSGLFWSYLPGHVATALLPCKSAWRFVPGHLRLQTSNVSRWATFLEPRQTVDYFTPRYVSPYCLGSWFVAPQSGFRVATLLCLNDSDVSNDSTCVDFGGGVYSVLFLGPRKQSCTAATMHAVAASCCQGNGNMPS